MMSVFLLFLIMPLSIHADPDSSEQKGPSIEPCSDTPDNQGNMDYTENLPVKLDAASDLIERQLPCEQAEQLKLGILDPSEYDEETFEIKPGPKQHITISGSSTSA